MMRWIGGGMKKEIHIQGSIETRELSRPNYGSEVRLQGETRIEVKYTVDIPIQHLPRQHMPASLSTLTAISTCPARSHSHSSHIVHSYESLCYGKSQHPRTTLPSNTGILTIPTNPSRTSFDTLPRAQHSEATPTTQSQAPPRERLT